MADNALTPLTAKIWIPGKRFNVIISLHENIQASIKSDRSASDPKYI